MSAVLHEDEFARRAAALEARVGADPPTTWRPNDPDKEHPRAIVGELVRVDEGNTAYGAAKIVVLRDGEGRDWHDRTQFRPRRAASSAATPNLSTLLTA